MIDKGVGSPTRTSRRRRHAPPMPGRWGRACGPCASRCASPCRRSRPCRIRSSRHRCSAPTSVVSGPSRCRGCSAWPSSTTCPSTSCCRRTTTNRWGRLGARRDAGPERPAGAIRAWDGNEKVTIDLTKLHSVSGPERDLLRRFLSMIQVQRQDFNGRMITIRAEDLRAIACLFGVTRTPWAAASTSSASLASERLRIVGMEGDHVRPEPIPWLSTKEAAEHLGRDPAQPLPLHRRGDLVGLQVRPGHPIQETTSSGSSKPAASRPGASSTSTPSSRAPGRRPMQRRGRASSRRGERHGPADRWPTACSAASWPASTRRHRRAVDDHAVAFGTSTRRRRSTSWSSPGVTSTTPATVRGGRRRRRWSPLVTARRAAPAEGIADERLPVRLQRGRRRLQLRAPPPSPRPRRPLGGLRLARPAGWAPSRRRTRP